MQELHGMKILTTLPEILSPRHTALLLVDFQNDFCHPDGVSPRRLELDLSRTKRAIERTARVLEAARGAGVLVIYTLNTHGVGLSPVILRLLSRTHKRDKVIPAIHCIDGTWGHEVVEELRPREDEILLRKTRPTAFLYTNLRQIFVNKGIQSVVVTGVTTNGCVLASAMDALYHDYYSVVLEDCSAAYSQLNHDNAVQLMRNFVDVASSDEVVGLWKGAPHS